MINFKFSPIIFYKDMKTKSPKQYVMTDDTYVNIFLSRDFKEKRGSCGLKFFQHKPSKVFVTYDPKGIQTRVIITKDESGLESIYEGDSIREVKQALDNAGVLQTIEAIYVWVGPGYKYF